MEFTFKPIGVIHSCFKEKFGIPRQPGLVSEARATLELLPPYDREESLTGLEGFSHVWISFVFHANLRQKWKPTVRPPRLGGNRRVGVFATRSTFRPNPMGLSAVKLEGIGREGGRLLLRLRGVDLLDGTPVLDIKPYLPYADIIPDAAGGFAPEAPTGSLEVEFTPEALEFCRRMEGAKYPFLRKLIVEILQNDPRPAYYGDAPRKKDFGMRILDFDLKWRMNGESILVTSLSPI